MDIDQTQKAIRMFGVFTAIGLIFTPILLSFNILNCPFTYERFDRNKKYWLTIFISMLLSGLAMFYYLKG